MIRDFSIRAPLPASFLRTEFFLYALVKNICRNLRQYDKMVRRMIQATKGEGDPYGKI